MARLLLIDDSLQDAARFMQILASNGYLVEHVVTLAEGYARTRQRDFDAILLDLTLPDSSGMETLLGARAKLPAMPIVVLTDEENDKVVESAILRGAQEFLMKSAVTEPWLVQSVKHAIIRGQLLEAPTENGEDEITPADANTVWDQATIDDVVILRLLPKRLLDASVIVTIEERLTSLIEAGNRQLIVNLGNVEYISNAALGVLIGTQKKIRTNNGSLHLADLKKNVRNQLGSRQFHRLFRIYDDVESALASIAATP